MKKYSRTPWEKILKYPSFNTRFGFIIVVIVFVSGTLLYQIVPLFPNASDKIEILNLGVQSVTLILGIFGAYYALRQLVETRFSKLEETGLAELQQKRYYGAIKKWKEALYIRSDSTIFCNLAEAFILIGDYGSFDEHISTIKKGGPNFNLIQDDAEELTLLYLKITRHLLVENLGAAKEFLDKLVLSCKETKALEGFSWNFKDLVTSNVYNALQGGESKSILDNLILYLKKSILAGRRADFENKDYDSQNTL